MFPWNLVVHRTDAHGTMTWVMAQFAHKHDAERAASLLMADVYISHYEIIHEEKITDWSGE